MNEIVLSNQLTDADDLPAPTFDEVKNALEMSIPRIDPMTNAT